MNASGAGPRTAEKILDALGFAALAVFAWQMTFWAGERGFFAFDQSLTFDGGYRVFSGQVPYRDFLSVHGCLVFLMQGLVFKVLGVNYFAFIAGAAAVNVAASFLAFFFIRALFPGRKIAAYAAAFLTAVWFYPPFGTPWHKQTGFFFALAGFYLLASSFRTGISEKRANAFGFGAGAAAFLAAMGYQAVGLLAFPLFPLLISAAEWPDRRKMLRSSAIFLIGFLICGGAFALWILLRSDWTAFWTYAVVYPAALAAERAASGGWGKFFEALFMGFTAWGPSDPILSPPPVKVIPLWIRLLLLAAYAASVATLVRFFRGSAADSSKPERREVAAVFCIGITHLQYFFIASTLNSSLNGLPFIGIAAILGFILMDDWIRSVPAVPGARKSKMVFVTIVAMSFFALTWRGVRFALDRGQHFPYTLIPAEFSRTVPARNLKPLRWGTPAAVVRVTPAERNNVTEVLEEDFTGLLDYLQSRKIPFFVFPDYTLLYGLAGVPSPQPLLWFHKGWTYPRQYDSRLDERVVADLVKNDVGIVVMEKDSFLGTAEILSDFPLLASFLQERFAPVRSFGIFQVFELRRESPQ